MRQSNKKRESIDGTCRNWCFTLYQSVPVWEPKIMLYLIAGDEVCPTTGRKHYQCYAEFKNPVRRSKLQGMYPEPDFHVGKRIGTREQAILYCSKDGKFKEFGKSLASSITKSPVSSRVTRDLLSDFMSDYVIKTHPDYCRYPETKERSRFIEAFLKSSVSPLSSSNLY